MASTQELELETPLRFHRALDRLEQRCRNVYL
jgi:hypothetical protein